MTCAAPSEPPPVTERPVELQPVPRAEDHDGLAMKIVNQYRWGIGPCVDFEDLVQAARMGLMHACTKFDRSKGFKFSTYASWWVRHYVLRTIQDQRNTVRVPVYRQEKDRIDGNEPAVRMLSGDYEYNSDRSTQGTTIFDAIGDPDTDCQGLDVLLGEERVTTGRALLGMLEGNQKRVVQAFFWDGKNLREIGEELGLSRERVRQIKKAALLRLRERASAL